MEITMKLNYFDLLSPAPVYIPKVGGIISPTLKEISSIGINTYQYYLSVMNMDLKSYFTMMNRPDLYEAFSNEEKSQLNLFDLLIRNEQSALLLKDILNFFIKETVVYSPINRCLSVMDNEKIIGIITKEVYPQVCDLICQRNCVKSAQNEDMSKTKSKKALEIMEKLQKGRAEKAKQNNEDKNMELGNIISAVAGKSHSINLLNIWDLTVFQIQDYFLRLSNNSIYDIQSMSVAAWGNKNNSFDATAWFKRI